MVTDTVTAYDTASGERKWQFFTEGPVRFAPSFHDGKVYVGSDDGHLYCIDAATGKLVWKVRGSPSDRRILGNERLISTWPVRGGPVVHEGIVYFTAGIWPFMGIFACAVDAETGEFVWRNSAESMTYQTHPHGAPSFGGFVPRGHLAVTEKGLVAPGGRTSPGVYNLKTGKLEQFTFGGKGKASTHHPVPISVGGRKFESEKWTQRNKPLPDEGKITGQGFEFIVDGNVWTLLAGDDRLFAVSTTGKIYCFGGAEGEPKTYEVKASPANVAASWNSEAEQILEATDTEVGYGVCLGLGTGNLAEAVARNSQLHVVVVDPDATKVDAFRRKMIDAGFYGTRVAAIVGDAKTQLPPYFANLVVSEDISIARGDGQTMIATIFRSLRPYGGTAYLPVGASRLDAMAKERKLENAVTKSAGKASLLIRKGALPGAADWTHHYANAGNTGVSNDTRTRLPLGLLWFGGPSNDEVLPRHGHGPSPQVAAGRLVIEGANMLRAIDVYTGRLLWQKEFPKLGHFYNTTRHQGGAGEIGSNYVTLPDSIYVVYGQKILKLDPATGETKQEIDSSSIDPDCPDWASIAVTDDCLVVTLGPVALPKKKEEVRDSRLERIFTPAKYSSASRRLVVLDRKTGNERWNCFATYGFRHNNISLGKGRIFCIDALSAEKLSESRRRGMKGEYRPRLMCLDLKTGDILWQTRRNVFGTFLNYSSEYDVLLQAGSRSKDRAHDEIGSGMIVYRGKDGEVLWEELSRKYNGPCLLHKDTIIAQGPGFSLLTGEPKMLRHPLTDREMPWQYKRHYGCNTAIAGQNLITFRSGAAGFYDIENHGGTGNFGGFKSSCTSNLIVADGLLLAPEYTRTCRCAYQNQTSLAMVHDPDTELWTFNSFSWDKAPVRRVGINFGAPGDRRVGSEMLWLDCPSKGGDSPDIPIKIRGDASYHRQHSATIVHSNGKSDSAPPWVAASTIEGMEEITLTLSDEPTTQTYTVRLHFAELDRHASPGSRVFGVKIQGTEVLKDFDIHKEAGGATHTIVKEFTNLKVNKNLTLGFTPSTGKPILSGLEIVQE
jgi:outer membrane protein assembly factor BamB